MSILPTRASRNLGLLQGLWKVGDLGIMPSIERVQVECPYTALTLDNKVFCSILFNSNLYLHVE